MPFFPTSNNPPSFLKRGLGGVNLLRLTLIFLLSFSLTACWASEKVIHWKQEVKLRDERVIMLDRLSTQIGPGFPGNVYLEKSQAISFVNPDTQEKISWNIPKGLNLHTLDFENKVPYLVLKAYTVADYNNWNCPNPPYMVYRYENKQWQPLPFKQLPEKVSRRNLMDMSRSIDEVSSDNIITPDEQQSWLRRLDEGDRTISRRLVHPIAKGCYPDILIKQGRESEINVPYYNNENVLIKPRVN